MKWIYLTLGIIGLLPGIGLLLPMLLSLLGESNSKNIIGGRIGPTAIWLKLGNKSIELNPSWIGAICIFVGMLVYVIGLLTILKKPS